MKKTNQISKNERYLKKVSAFVLSLLMSAMMFGQSLPGFYQQYFRVHDMAAPFSYVWDQSMNTSNLQASNWHGGNNQRWLFMPICPESDIFVIVSKHNGYVVDLEMTSGSTKNAKCSGDIHLGNNQVFELVNDTGNVYQINEKVWNTYVMDRALSDGKNIHFSSPHGGNNQKWEMTQIEAIPNAFTTYIKKTDEPIPVIPRPTDINGTGAVENGPEIIAGEVILPYLFIKYDPLLLTASQKLASSPYYKLRRSIYYHRVWYRTFSDLGEVFTSTYKTGNTTTFNQSFKNYTSWEFTASGKINLNIGDPNKASLGTELSNGIKNTTGFEAVTSVSIEETQERTISHEVTKAAGSSVFLACYVIAEKFQLYRMDGTLINQWVYYPDKGNPGDLNSSESRVSYPETVITVDKTKSGSTVTEKIYVNDPGLAPTTNASDVVITNLTATSATISWKNGNGAKRAVFLENPQGIAAAPYDNTTYTASSDWNNKGTRISPTKNYYCIYNGYGNSVTVTNLSPNSRYTVKISEYNGTAGKEKYMTNYVSGNPKVFYTPALPPTTQASNVVITNLTSTSATVSWTNGNGAKRVVFAENPSGTAASPYNNTTYSASANWNLKGTRIGTSYYYCVYNGTGNSVTLTNLSPNSRYTIKISEYNGSVGSEQYLTPYVSGNPKVFYTPASTLKSANETNDIQQISDAITSVKVSPNPSSGLIKVEAVKQGDESMNISISNLQGNVVYKGSTDQSSFDIDLTGVAPGIYIVKVDVGSVTTVHKVIKN